MTIQTLANIRFEQQIGYNKFLFKNFKEEGEALQLKYYSKGKKPTENQLNKLQTTEYMANHYYNNMKEQITELKKEEIMVFLSKNSYSKTIY
ncbi:MAG: hypothetical protein ACRCVW_06880 [Brevinema sp.]